VARRLRILFAGLALPYPPLNGHRLRTGAMVRALAEDDHEVTLVSFAEADELGGDQRPLWGRCAVVQLVPGPGRKSPAFEALDRLRGLASPLPYAVRRLRSAEFRSVVERALATRAFDAVVCDGVYNVQNLPSALGVPVLLNKDDVASVILGRYLKLERNPARRLYGQLEARKVLRWERLACAQMTAVLACSDVDRALLERVCPGVPISVVPNVVDTEHYAPSSDQERCTVLFQGGMDWHPNRDAVEFFVSAILPGLRERVGDITFRVAGRSPSDAFRRRLAASPGVEFTGAVPDIRREIARATISVVPLRIGSGTRLKILEAGAMGKPIVSTALGAEGLELVDGDDILLADTPRAFTDAIATLLADDGRRQALGRAVRRKVEQHYSYPVLRAALRRGLEEAGL
jgi:glycosyltransferase involved in cell wall biosynthesis